VAGIVESPMSESGEKPLHVLTLTPFYPSTSDDAYGCFVAEVLPFLSEFAISNSVMMVQPFYRSRLDSSRDEVPAENKRFFCIPGGIGLASSGGFLFAKIVGDVRDMHTSKPISVIHAHSALPCGHAAALLSRELGIPFVVTVHGLDAFSTVQVRGYAGKWCRRVSEWVYHQASQVICVSEKVRQNVLFGAPNAKTRVVFNGVDEQKFVPEESNGSSMLCVGNLNSAKGQSLLIRAFATVAVVLPEVTCEFIGNGPDRESLRTLARELGIESRVKFRGRQSRREVARAMRECLLFALPSRYEALGCVYLEAMSCGKAAIGCRGQGIDEVIEHGVNGWLVDPENLDQLTQAILEFTRNEFLRKSMGIAARETILGGFTLAHQAESLAEVYREYVS